MRILNGFFNCKSAIHSSPVVCGQYVFFGSDDGRLYAINKTNRDLAWSFSPGYTIDDDDVNKYITTPILSNPVTENGIVYIGIKGNVSAIDVQTYETPEKSIKEKSRNPDYNHLIFFCIIPLQNLAWDWLDGHYKAVYLSNNLP